MLEVTVEVACRVLQLHAALTRTPQTFRLHHLPGRSSLLASSGFQGCYCGCRLVLFHMHICIISTGFAIPLVKRFRIPELNLACSFHAFFYKNSPVLILFLRRLYCQVYPMH
jgi:hypothetical protein